MPGGVSSGWPQSVSCITYAYTHCIFCVRLLQWVSALAGHSLCPALHMHTHTAYFVSGFCSGCQLWLATVCVLHYICIHTLHILCQAFAVGVSSGWPQSVSCITYAYTHRIFVCQAFEVGVSSGWPQSVSCITYAYTHCMFCVRLLKWVSALAGHSLCPALHITYAYTHSIVLCQAFSVGVSSGWTVKRVCVEVFSFEHSYRIQLRISGANLASLCMQQQHANVACIDFKLGCVVE